MPKSKLKTRNRQERWQAEQQSEVARAKQAAQRSDNHRLHDEIGDNNTNQYR